MAGLKNVLGLSELSAPVPSSQLLLAATDLWPVRKVNTLCPLICNIAGDLKASTPFREPHISPQQPNQLMSTIHSPTHPCCPSGQFEAIFLRPSFSSHPPQLQPVSSHLTKVQGVTDQQPPLPAIHIQQAQPVRAEFSIDTRGKTYKHFPHFAAPKNWVGTVLPLHCLKQLFKICNNKSIVVYKIMSYQ